MKLQFSISHRPEYRVTDIYLFGTDEHGNGFHAKPVEMEPHAETGIQIPPMMRIDGRDDRELLQSLMDELWRNGVRPMEIGTAGHLATTQAHLADFRALLSKAMDVKLP